MAAILTEYAKLQENEFTQYFLIPISFVHRFSSYLSYLLFSGRAIVIDSPLPFKTSPKASWPNEPKDQ